MTAPLLDPLLPAFVADLDQQTAPQRAATLRARNAVRVASYAGFVDHITVEAFGITATHHCNSGFVESADVGPTLDTMTEVAVTLWYDAAWRAVWDDSHRARAPLTTTARDILNEGLCLWIDAHLQAGHTPDAVLGRLCPAGLMRAHHGAGGVTLRAAQITAHGPDAAAALTAWLDAAQACFWPDPPAFATPHPIRAPQPSSPADAR